jgi:methylphosphotriester-DNA--protein-cysteine methyltransferase
MHVEINGERFLSLPKHAIWVPPAHRAISALRRSWPLAHTLTARTLERRCMKELGMPLNEWRQRLKLLRAIDELDGGAQVQQIAHTLGYATPSAFIVMFKRMTGTTPEQYRLSR